MIAPSHFLATPVGEHLSGLVREAFQHVEADERGTPPGIGVGAEEDATGGGRFGPYRVTGEIGRGGMGMVYEAERADRTYERRVAIKTVPFAAPGGKLADGFETERRILAGLEHENIARLYEAGTTPDGIPYFVMELVEGRRIDVYCDEEDLSVDERLALFERVCEAVEYAHGKLIVHGDIKPGNILVTADGVPKLLDFGVARLLEPDVGDRGDPDAPDDPGAPRLLAMTPEYASPEQLRGEPTSTAADVYALGVLLYVLLAGRHPYPPVRRTRAAVERVIRETTIAPPSAVLPPEDRARRRRLRGDLDAIVLAAIRPDASERYGSVVALRRDLRDHREGLPVAARPATWRYRAAKFVRRHRAAAGFVLALAAATVAIGVQSAAAARERDRAELRAAETQEVADFLVGLFEGADPQREPGTRTARELLDLGAERLEDEPLANPLTRARLLETVAGAYHQLRFLDPAARLFEQAIELREREQGPEHPDLLDPLLGLATAQMWSIRYAAAESTLARAAAIGERLPEPGSRELLRILVLQGNLHLVRDSPQAAEAVFRRALSLQERRGAADRGSASLLNNLGVAVENQGRLAEAERIHRRALDVRRAAHGRDHPAVAQSLVNLGRVALGRAEDAAAEQVLDEALTIREEALGPDHPGVAEVLQLRAEARLRQERPDEAEVDLRRAVRVREARLGSRHPVTALTRFELARVLTAGNGHDEALSLVEEAVAAFRESEDAPPADLRRAEALLAELRQP